MKRFSADVVAAVDDAIRAVRRALDDLDPDDVPAALRRVVAHSGPRLTPPLAGRLIGELESLEWLRTDALERLDDDASPAARAFLERNDHWWVEVTDAAAAHRMQSSAGAVRSLEERNAKQRTALETAKAKLKQERSAAKDRLVSLRDEVKALRLRVDAAERADGRSRARLDDRIERLEADLAEARDDLADADRMLAGARRRYRVQRRELADARRAVESGPSSLIVRDPLALARELDLAAASVPRRQGEAEPTTDAGPAAGRALTIPVGIRPDRAEAVDWLLTQAGVTVIVDGYNLLFNLEPGEFTSGRSRRRLGALMAHVVRKSRRGLSIHIVFDSALPGGRDTRWASPGVAVAFAEAGRLADEEVVRLAGSTAGPVVVVSSDREVREDAEAAGAVVLWSEAFVEWLAAQPVAMPPSK